MKRSVWLFAVATMVTALLGYEAVRSAYRLGYERGRGVGQCEIARIVIRHAEPSAENKQIDDKCVAILSFHVHEKESVFR